MTQTQWREPTGFHVEHADELPPPLFILAPARSFTSITCAMLGQHPQMYGLPETNLFCEETVGARARRVERATYPMGQGLLRAVAQLHFGAQDLSTVRMARQWLSARSELTTDFLFKVLADRVFPLLLIDKSPSTVNRLEVLRRIHGKFPGACFLHLVRHPRGQGESVMKAIEERRKEGPLPPTHWLLRIACYPSSPTNARGQPDDLAPAPQNWWYARNTLICRFLQSVPPERRMRVRGEDVLAEPDRILPDIAAWLGVRTDASAVEDMKHPERSPYAFLGPPGARFGNDKLFLQDPVLRPRPVKVHSLEGPLSWHRGGEGFAPEVKALAREFGYT
jgi:Sulfotransferase family